MERKKRCKGKKKECQKKKWECPGYKKDNVNRKTYLISILSTLNINK